MLLARITSTIGDPDGTRTVTSIIVLLIALGIALAMVAVWLYRSTRPDPELLAPLEVMSERRWRRADPVGQRRTLDQARPSDAAPLAPSVAPPQLDEAFDAGPTAVGFDDLDGELDTRSSAGMVPPPSDFAPPMAGTAETPRQIERPELSFDEEIDPEVLAAAEAALDAELGRANEG